ncbi:MULTISPECIES: hypothetical protein [unclassified Methanoculleus]|jgi:hypothetical protein|uniref:DUF1499 domain-containing protein n=1 Tax=Methanoculleus palmolei TaxID=72612 RepID=A0ABD8A9Q3_9EURY|nr:hypothetical protein [Methanoculleus sp. UBA377]WOX56256.1 hypothetical protein R6Y95_02705 [Methanoculleus palmolei]
MKKILYIVIACAAAAALILVAAPVLPETVPENQTARPTDAPREKISFIEVHARGGGSTLLYPEDPRYSALEAECREQIRCISAQYKTGFSREELDAMKRNATYVAMHFPVSTTCETSYIVDGSPKEIIVNEAIFFLDLEDRPETMIITRAENETGVWDTSRDRREFRDLVAPIVREL